MAGIFMFILELQHIPGLRVFDASHVADRFNNDFESPAQTQAPPGLQAPSRPGGPAGDGPFGGASGPPSI
jgi:hypothetical protein